jgi:hypothetical protein
MEVRYIIFTPEEARSAIISFVQKQGQVTASNDVAAVELVDPGEAPTAIVRLQAASAGKPIRLGGQYLTAALLLYCTDRRIPVPKQAAKKVELSVNGLTLAMTTDRTQGLPCVANHQVTYGEIANRATQRLGTVQEELARAIARADYAESLVAQAEERARKAQAARGRSSALLTAIALVPGLRGHVGRWLVGFTYPISDER